MLNEAIAWCNSCSDVIVHSVTVDDSQEQSQEFGVRIAHHLLTQGQHCSRLDHRHLLLVPQILQNRTSDSCVHTTHYERWKHGAIEASGTTQQVEPLTPLSPRISSFFISSGIIRSYAERQKHVQLRPHQRVIGLAF